MTLLLGYNYYYYFVTRSRQGCAFDAMYMCGSYANGFAYT